MLSRYKKTLISLFSRIQELRAAPIQKRLLALDIQEELLLRICRAESLIRKARAASKAIKVQLSFRHNDRAAATLLKRKYENEGKKIEQQRELILVLRSIGDAIPFIYGDRWDLKQLALKEEAGFISGKKGTRLERKILRHLYAIGATAVMNDLTHTLRHGDITLFHPDLWSTGDSPFLLIEAKTGKGGNKHRMERQCARGKELFNYLATDKKDAEGGTWRRVAYRGAPKYHGEKFTSAAAGLSKGDFISLSIEKGLQYILFDGHVTTDKIDTALQSVFKRNRSFYFMSANDAKREHLGYFPFTLSIHDPDVLYRFYNGEFVLFVCVDLEHINKKLASKGIKIEPSTDDAVPWHIVPTRDGIFPDGTEQGVGFHPIGRLGREFLSLDWFIKNMILGPGYETLKEQLALLNATYPCGGHVRSVQKQN